MILGLSGAEPSLLRARVWRAGAWWDGARAHRALLWFGLPQLDVLRATGAHGVLIPSSGWVLLLEGLSCSTVKNVFFFFFIKRMHFEGGNVLVFFDRWYVCEARHFWVQ